MDEIQRALADAWRRVAPLLARDADARRRRLARRRSRLIESPPRAWCLAVRATDTRLDRSCITRPRKDERHQVLLDSADLKKLCAPVFLPRPGLAHSDVARLLGVAPHGLLDAR